MLMTRHSTTLSQVQEGAHALLTLCSKETAGSLVCSVSCVTHITAAEQVSMESRSMKNYNIPCHLPSPANSSGSLPSKIFSYASPLLYLKFTEGAKSQACVIPEISSLAQNTLHRHTSFIIFFALSLRQLSFFVLLFTFRPVPSAHCSRETCVHCILELPCF